MFIKMKWNLTVNLFKDVFLLFGISPINKQLDLFPIKLKAKCI
jgi:hypothetical protein